MTIRTLAFALAIACSPAIASAEKTDSSSDLDALRFLAGSCWTAAFPDGGATDTHCWEAMLGDAFIRDVHVVNGRSQPYSGESIYGVDPETGEFGYTYYNSLGGISSGRVVVFDDRIEFPGETHTTTEGETIVMRSIMRRTGDDSYSMTTEQETPEGWRTLWSMQFERAGDAP
ncbi:DUF1579 family protein [Erythrobacter rubeus]|uniref:DUF1579 family protein n=1 Tax=Erythrobacter rubeus TaxID=2760803 RepID=A0ABR8KU49_9SPHN|nr:DUF1579 family protein [Erythrobacter rubeus]MBD2842598.1 DUF1579 family protein [Erythrobacter rubeus]